MILYPTAVAMSMVQKIKERMSYEACFVAGTLVHTINGLIPIELLKVGDWVLSKDENGIGPTEYKQIVSVFKSDVKRPIMSPLIQSNIYCTEEHPFWVKGRGWVPAKQIDERDIIELLTPGPSRDNCDFGRYDQINGLPSIENMGFHMWATEIPHLAIIPKTNQWKYNNSQHYGYELVDFSDGRPRFILLDQNDDSELDQFIETPCDPKSFTTADERDYKILLKDRDKELISEYRELFYYGLAGGVGEPYCEYVYNLEVDDFHTYFVGEMGIWVHNTKKYSGNDKNIVLSH